MRLNQTLRYLLAVLMLPFFLTSCGDDDGDENLNPDPAASSPYVSLESNSMLTDGLLGLEMRVNLAIGAGDSSEVAGLESVRLEVSGVNAATFPLDPDSLTFLVPDSLKYSYMKLIELGPGFLQSIGKTTIKAIAKSKNGETVESAVTIETVDANRVLRQELAPRPFGDTLAAPFVFAYLPLEQEAPLYVPQTVTDNPFFQADFVYFINATGPSFGSISVAKMMFPTILVNSPKQTMFVKTNLSKPDYDAIGLNSGGQLQVEYQVAASSNTPSQQVNGINIGDVISFKTDAGRYGMIQVDSIDMTQPDRPISIDIKTQF